jgi:hypothetical protein
MSENLSLKSESKIQPPVRGSLRLHINTSSPQVTAGSDFSIFVVIQNPFDVPITIHQVQTHIPVELIDINGLRLDLAKREKEYSSTGFLRNIFESIKYRLTTNKIHSGIAIAVGTDFDPKAEREFFKMNTSIQTMGESSQIIGIQFSFPQNPTSEDLDRIFRRISDYKQGLIPVQLQPGNSIIKQFVLRTRHWIFFTPLTHRFQIQVNYTADGDDHTDTIAYEQSIRSTMSAMVIGAASGAILGTLLNSLSSNTSNGSDYILRALIVSVIASFAVVVAFARKSTVQPIVSVEDFWGGALIGFMVGYLGFDQFSGLFGNSQAQ